MYRFKSFILSVVNHYEANSAEKLDLDDGTIPAMSLQFVSKNEAPIFEDFEDLVPYDNTAHNLK